MNRSEKLRLACWNCSGAYSSFGYLKQLLQTTDILAVSEHWLYCDSVSFLDSLDENFECFARCSKLNDLNLRWRRGQGGVAIFWRRTLDCQNLSGGNDRLVAIKLKGTLNLVICSVYFPSSNRSLTEFKKTLDDVEQFYYEQKANGTTVVIMGDFNAHLQVLRSNQSLNARGRLLQAMLTKLNLCAVNTEVNCVGQTNTYISSCGNSMIDYILIEKHLVPSVQRVEILAETPDNTAFHLPVVLHIEVGETQGKNSTFSKERIAWSKCSTNNIDTYIEELSKYLPADILPEKHFETPADIDAQVSLLCRAIIQADQMLPRIVYNKKIKPYWTAKLNRLKKISRQKFKNWISEGRPRGMQYASYADYKRAKSVYRRENRNAARRTEQQEFDEISNASEIDHVKFWRYVNRKRGNRRKRNVRLKFNGETVSDPHKLADLWADYYELLFTPSLKFDEQFKMKIDSEVECVMGRDELFDGILDKPITIEEIQSIVRKLPAGKAPGHDGVFYEHIKLGERILLLYLVQLFNSVIKVEYIPSSFKLAVKIPIPKGGKAFACTFDDHRGISLLTTFNKIMERIILLRIQQKPQCIPHSLQGAYRSEHDALTTAFIIDETIKHCCEENDKVYVCYVDITKAFDNLWINGMLFKLYQNMGIKGKCLKIIQHWYTGMKEMVRIDDCYSRCYNLLQGTRQGGVLSPWLFTVFVNDLISFLQGTAQTGVVLYGMYYGSPMYADDITMLSRLKNGLDRMLKLLYDYGLLWRITFNQTKTVTMVFGEKTVDSQRNVNRRVWLLGDIQLREKDVWKNLGKIWHVKATDMEPIEDAVKKGYAAGVELAGVGCRSGGINPITSSKLWKRVVLPKMLYGSELWQLSKQKCLMLEKCQNIFVRVIEGLLPGTSGSAARGLLGLWSIEGEIEKKKLSFFGRLLNSSHFLAQRKLLIIRILRWKYRYKVSTGFVPDVMNIVLKHDLWTYIEIFLEHGTFPSNTQWKRVVFKAIKATEESFWRDRLASKGMERYLRIHGELKPSCWYYLLQRHPTTNRCVMTVVRLLCNSFMVNEKRINATSVVHECHGCGNTFGDPVAHIVLTCCWSQEPRENFWEWLMDNMPMEFYSCLVQMDDDELLDVLLGRTITLSPEFLDDFLVHSAYYIHRCVTVSKLITIE